jgi:hypothetical protein
LCATQVCIRVLESSVGNSTSITPGPRTIHSTLLPSQHAYVVSSSPFFFVFYLFL